MRAWLRPPLPCVTMCHIMKKASIRELHDKTGRLVKRATDGERVIILRRGVPVAELRALSAASLTAAMPDRRAILEKFPSLPDSSESISKSRDRS